MPYLTPDPDGDDARRSHLLTDAEYELVVAALARVADDSEAEQARAGALVHELRDQRAAAGYDERTGPVTISREVFNAVAGILHGYEVICGNGLDAAFAHAIRRDLLDADDDQADEAGEG